MIKIFYTKEAVDNTKLPLLYKNDDWIKYEREVEIHINPQEITYLNIYHDVGVAYLRIKDKIIMIGLYDANRVVDEMYKNI